MQENFRHVETHNPVSREELMMVLAGLEQLQIRALFSQISSSVSLHRVALEVASEMGSGPPASNVELCMCPANYRGDSCQVRSGEGARLGARLGGRARPSPCVSSCAGIPNPIPTSVPSAFLPAPCPDPCCCSASATRVTWLPAVHTQPLWPLACPAVIHHLSVLLSG